MKRSAVHGQTPRVNVNLAPCCQLPTATSTVNLEASAPFLAGSFVSKLSYRLSRRGFLYSALTFAASGCSRLSEQPDLLWGKRGVMPGDFVRPRAIVILPGDRLYIVDFTARIQAYDADGKYLGITWQSPDYRNGRPSGLDVTRDGNV